MSKLLNKAALALSVPGLLLAAMTPAQAHDRGWKRGHDRSWGDDRDYYRDRDDGTTGLLIGAAAGGLLGREVAGPRGDRTAGLIIGAAAGALLGRAVDRGDSRCR
jgi:hypothetical protein